MVLSHLCVREDADISLHQAYLLHVYLLHVHLLHFTALRVFDCIRCNCQKTASRLDAVFCFFQLMQ